MTLQTRVAPYARADTRDALWQLANTLLSLGTLGYLMWRAHRQAYPLTLLLAVPAAGLLVRVFVIQHDCRHGSFFPSARANRVTGRLCSLLTLTPYGYWRRPHSAHHATSSDLRRRAGFDVPTLTRREYEGLSAPARRLYRLARHPFVLFGLAPAVYFVSVLRCPLLARASWKGARRSTLATDGALAAAAAAGAFAFGQRGAPPGAGSHSPAGVGRRLLALLCPASVRGHLLGAFRGLETRGGRVARIFDIRAAGGLTMAHGEHRPSSGSPLEPSHPELSPAGLLRRGGGLARGTASLAPRLGQVRAAAGLGRGMRAPGRAVTPPRSTEGARRQARKAAP
jgi:Fatty acid desaturase